MDFNMYQQRAMETAVYPNKGNNIIYPTLGLCGEAGEIAEKIKKMIRDSGGVLSDELRRALKKELGDVLWYLAALAEELNLDLADIAQTNIDKLYDRKRRGKLHGSGDDR